MRRLAQTLMVFGLVFGFALTGRGGDDEAGKIIDKAIKAHFPKGVDTKNNGSRTKAKGTLHIMGLDLEFTQEIAVQAPNKFKEVMDLDVMGKKVPVVTVFNGKEGWIQSDGKDVKVTDEILDELKGATQMIRLMKGMFVKDKTVKYSLIGEVKVKDKAAIGVTVSQKGAKDVSLFFDKRTGLIVKVEMRRRDVMAGQEVTEERFINEYQDLNGQKVAKKVEVLRNGKALLEIEILEVQLLEKLDDAEFARPK
jgi:hypothetical protein